jgi:hypothetical protein
MFKNKSYCCQGAEESDGIKLNKETNEIEFILYYENNIVWHPVYYCPLCGFNYKKNIKE